MLKIMCLAMACLLAGLMGGTAHADQFTTAQRAEIVAIVRDALMQDPSILRDAINALKADEGSQQNAQLAASRTRLEDGGAVTGNPQGDVTIVEFFDTRCPYCRRLEPVMAKLLAQDHGVRLVYKDLPILGPPSVLGSKALLAAHQAGRLRTIARRDHGGATADHEGDRSRRQRRGSAWIGRDWRATWMTRRSRRRSRRT